ncbi:MAG: hypothetical protein LRY67_03700 [Gammaproteobacteria bacterium]|nr:hypothetical protein [Gammaproteobacteria bacterium]
MQNYYYDNNGNYAHHDYGQPENYEDYSEKQFTFIDSLEKFYTDVICKSDSFFTQETIEKDWRNFASYLQENNYPRKHWDYLTDEEKNILFCLTQNKPNTPWIEAYKKAKKNA